jgi:hypothetical protein
MMFGETHPNCRGHHNWLLLRDKLGSSATDFATEEGINASRKMRPMLLG